MPINDPLSRWRKKKGKKKRKERFETSNDDYWRGKVAIPERERERKKERKEEDERKEKEREKQFHFGSCFYISRETHVCTIVATNNGFLTI